MPSAFLQKLNENNATMSIGGGGGGGGFPMGGMAPPGQYPQPGAYGLRESEPPFLLRLAL